MKEIFPGAKSIRAVLGTQRRREDVEYRLLTYCAQAAVPEGLLLYNAMTNAFVLLNPEEAAQMGRNEELIRNWFLVPSDQDDQRLADQLKATLQMMQPAKKRITFYTIFTTTDCNARCFYCFEKGRSRIPMGEETARQVVAYIRQNCGGHRVQLNWFGGEPLYNSKAIDLICQGLGEGGIQYTSRMTSNGYLFDEELLTRAVELWHLKRVQITLDGTEEVYNRSKAFIYREGSPYRRVVDNIEGLLDREIRVAIRLNFDLYNAENLFQLVEELTPRFRGRKGLTIYSHVLFEESIGNGKGRSEDQRSLVYEKQRALQAYLVEQGFAHYSLRREPRLNHCIADHDGAVTILPGGELGRCEHFSESEFIGHISSSQRDQEMIASWKEQCPPMEECAFCVSYPLCIRLKKCDEDGRQCFPETRDLKAWELEQAMRSEYQRFLSGQERTEPQEGGC